MVQLFGTDPSKGGPLDHDEVVRLMTRCYALLRAYVSAIVRDMDLAEDVIQEVSVVVIRKAARETTAQDFARWARGVARLQALKMLRDRRRQSRAMGPAVIDSMEGAWSRWEQAEAMGDRRKALRHCLARLPARARELLKLRYESTLSGMDIARRLGRRVEGVYVSLSRLHKTLSKCVRARLQENATS